MAGPYLKQWRKHRGLSQKQVVDRLASYNDENLPTTEASLSRIENGKQVWGQRIIEALAFIYDCETDELMTRDPVQEKARADALAKGGKVVDIRDMMLLSDQERARIVRMWNAVNERDTA